MAEVLSRELGIEAELVEGDKGIFDVAADGEVIFSKYREGRFPEPEEIIERLGAKS